jgi:predicted acetyltransferase
MNFEIRNVRPEEIDEFRSVAATSLTLSPDVLKGIQPEWTLCGFENERLISSYAAWPLNMRFNGEKVPVAGVTHVGTLPVYRRRGYLRSITSKHFEELYERGEQPIAILIASMAAIYQRYGYGVVSFQNSYKVEPRYLDFINDVKPRGTFRELGDDEFETLVSIYREFRAERTGYLHRSKAAWDFGILSSIPKKNQVSRIIYEENGKPLGYFIFSVPLRGPIPKQNLTIRDIAWLTPSAYKAIWSFFANMDVIENVIWKQAPVDDPLPHMILEPRMLNIATRDGILGRIVDVKKALTRRLYGSTGKLVFDIHDDFCPWNNGRWKLETSGEETSVSLTDESAEASMSVSTLSLLAFGQISATEAFHMGRFNVNNKESLGKYDSIFRTEYKPFCPDIF